MINKFKLTDYINPNYTNIKNVDEFFGGNNPDLGLSIENIINNDNFYKEVYTKLKPEDFDNPNIVMREMFLLIDTKLDIKTENELLNVVFTLGFGLPKMLLNIKSYISYQNPTAFKQNPLQNILNEVSKKMNNNLKSKYDYTIKDNLFIKDLYEENSTYKTVTNNIENVINEIIERESFQNIKNLRIFYEDTNKDVSEVIPIYDKNLCKSVIFNPF